MTPNINWMPFGGCSCPFSFKLRRVAIYVFYHQALDFAQLSEEWVDVIHRTRRDIEQDFPVTQLDLADWLSS
jgi:amicoumacin kinase